MHEQSLSLGKEQTSSQALPTGKSCAACGGWKPFSSFYRRAASPDGLQGHCKQCDNAKRRRHEEARPDLAEARYARYRARKPEARREWYLRNKDSLVRRVAAYKHANRDLVRVWARGYYQRNKEDFPARVAKRRAQKKQAIPPWADLIAIKAVYSEAIRRTKETGVKHHVDHIVPLQHELVCGLHCEANLRVLPAAENHSKSNRYWPGMP